MLRLKRLNLSKDFFNTCFTQDKSVITIGKFDALHLGHKALLFNLFKLSTSLNLAPCIVILHPNPCLITGYGYKNKYNTKPLYSIKQRVILIKQIYQEYLKLNCIPQQPKTLTIILQKFTPDFASLSHQDFVEQYLRHCLNAKHLVCYKSFKFGFEGLGDTSFLANNIATSIVPNVYLQDNQTALSANYIKTLIAKGDVVEANSLMFKNYSISGKVTRGLGLAGKVLGFKTANIILNQDKFAMPKYGVYKALVKLPKGPKYNAICNIGIKPSLDVNFNILTLEAHLLDADLDLYGLNIDIELLAFVRPEQKFDKMEDLKHQILKDIEIIQNTKYLDTYLL